MKPNLEQIKRTFLVPTTFSGVHRSSGSLVINIWQLLSPALYARVGEHNQELKYDCSPWGEGRQLGSLQEGEMSHEVWLLLWVMLMGWVAWHMLLFLWHHQLAVCTPKASVWLTVCTDACMSIKMGGGLALFHQIRLERGFHGNGFVSSQFRAKGFIRAGLVRHLK